MVRLQPGVLDINTDDVRFAGKLLEEESHGTIWSRSKGAILRLATVVNILKVNKGVLFWIL